MTAHGFDPHDHDHCIADALSAAEDACARRKLNLTPVRRRVLEILLQQHKAMGAYDILARLESEGLGSQPPVAYRALDFLVSNGFAHKIEGLNAYDVQAPIAVIEAAGGIVTDWKGGPVHEGGQVLAAANAQVHEAALTLLQMR